MSKLFQVLWIGCSDSRVPESVILGSKPGDIFVTRNIAKYVSLTSHYSRKLTQIPLSQVHLHDDNILSVLAYAIAELGVQHVVIAGHSQCGGAAACLAAAGTAPSKPRSPLQRWLAPLTALATELSSNPGHKLTPLELVEANVLAQVSNVVNSDVVQDAWSADPAIRGKAKLVAVHGWVYDIEKGRVRDLGASVYNQ